MKKTELKSRAGGRTFRNMLDALRGASEGKTVAYFINTDKPSRIKFYMDAAYKIATSYLPVSFVDVNQAKDRITMSNGGQIIFIGNDDRGMMRGIHGVKIEDD